MNDTVSGLIEGAIDIHVHAGPDIHPRYADCVDLVHEGRANKMAGVLIKDHNTNTADRAAILNAIWPDFTVCGAVTLNPPVGGLNPAAAEAAIRLGAKQVFMPTYAARNQVSLLGHGSHGLRHSVAFAEGGLSVLDDRDRVRPEVLEILRLIAESDVILGTGHISPPEIKELLASARQAGVKRILITHASLPIVDFPVADQVAAARSGVYVEQSFVATTSLFPSLGAVSVEKIAGQIRAVGPEQCVMSSDFGQANNPSPAEGLKQFVAAMLEYGVSESEITRMISTNPKSLLGIA